jgi:carboxypeptidase T
MPESGINNLIDGLKNVYPDFCQIINLENSREGRPIRAVKIGKGSSPTRRGVLFVGGIHARELLNPDALIYFAYNLAYAYKQKKAFTLGGQNYHADTVRLIIENMDIFILPLANPDGRAFVLAPNGDRMWRGNRAPNPGKACKGVDINRNFDFLWSSGIKTSTDACNISQLYKGPSAFSEPETRNVRQLLDSFPHIVGMIDVHSYSNFIMYPWGDDENQTTNSSMNFKNPAFNGQRGTPGDTYKEFIPKADLDWFVATANSMKQGIAGVRGQNYTVKQSVHLYATSATSTDYSYSRRFVNPAKRKVLAYCIETSPLVSTNGVPDYLKSFQPPFPEASCIMEDVQAAFMEFCIQILCAAQQLIDNIAAASQMAATMASVAGGSAQQPSRTGEKFVKLLQQNRDELMKLARQDTQFWRKAIVVLEQVMSVVQGQQETGAQVSDKALIRRVGQLLQTLGERGTPKLQRAAESIRQELQFFVGKTMVEGFRAADAQPRRRKKPSA